MRFTSLAFALALLPLAACGDDSVMGCPTGFELIGTMCEPIPDDGGVDAMAPDGGDAASECDASLVLYQDMDGDGFGDPAVSMSFCAPSVGWVEDASDCDDALETVNPDGTEVCDAVDNDCDDNVDEGLLELGEETSIAFGIRGTEEARIESYAPGFLVALSDGDQRKVVAVDALGGFTGTEWSLGITGRTVELHVLSDGLRALVVEEPDVGGGVGVRVVALDGASVSDIFPLVGESSFSDVRFVEVGGRVFASWIGDADGTLVRRAVEIDVPGNTMIGEAVTVCEFAEPGIFATGLSPLRAKVDGSGFFAVCVDRREGDLVAHAYLFDVAIAGALSVAEPVRFGSDAQAAVLVMLVEGFGSAAHTMLVAAAGEVDGTATYLRYSLDDALAETAAADPVEVPADASFLISPPSQPARWLIATDGSVGYLFLPPSERAEGQSLLLPPDLQDLAQRTPNTGAVVFQDELNEYRFQPIGCTR